MENPQTLLERFSMEDRPLVSRILESKQGGACKRLFNGDLSGYASWDDAAFTLSRWLAFWTGKDPEQMDRIIRASGIYRPEWDAMLESGDTYGAGTITAAINMQSETYKGQAGDAVDPSSPFYEYHEAYANIPGYESIEGCTVTVTGTGSKEKSRRPLANFTALPVEEVIRDDGAERTREFVIKGINAKGVPLSPVSVPASKFSAMGWVSDAWGMDASIYPGQLNKDKLRFAIQEAGRGNVPRRTVYTHTGWRQMPQGWAYLHNGGAIGAHGVSVELEGNLAQYDLTKPDIDLIEAARASRGLLSLVPPSIAYPILAHMYVSPLCAFMGPNAPAYILFLSGKTGTRKSTIAALALSHFGRGFSPKNPGASFSDTANNIRRKAFLMKDAPLLVDDLHPTSDMQKRRKMHGVAQELARAWGDRAERGRMSADLTLRASQPPRGTGIMTGEDIPDTGESGRARFYEIQVKAGDVPTGKALSTLQRQGANGYMAAAMAGYLEWLIPQADQLPPYLEGLFYDYRETMQEITPGAHGRLHEAGACLLVGWTMATAYWMGIEAITSTQAAEEAEAAQEAIASNIREQQRAMIADEPVGMFLRAVDELTASGKGYIPHIKNISGEYVPPPDLLGYQDDYFYYLIPGTAYGAVQRHYSEQGQTFPIGKTMLWRRLLEAGKLIPGADGGTTYKKRIGKDRPRIIQIAKSAQSVARNF